MNSGKLRLVKTHLFRKYWEQQTKQNKFSQLKLSEEKSIEKWKWKSSEESWKSEFWVWCLNRNKSSPFPPFWSHQVSKSALDSFKKQSQSSTSFGKNAQCPDLIKPDQIQLTWKFNGKQLDFVTTIWCPKWRFQDSNSPRFRSVNSLLELIPRNPGFWLGFVLFLKSSDFASSRII